MCDIPQLSNSLAERRFAARPDGQVFLVVEPCFLSRCSLAAKLGVALRVAAEFFQNLAMLVDSRFVALGKQSEIRMGCDGQIDKVAGKVESTTSSECAKAQGKQIEDSDRQGKRGFDHLRGHQRAQQVSGNRVVGKGFSTAPKTGSRQLIGQQYLGRCAFKAVPLFADQARWVGLQFTDNRCEGLAKTHRA
ncbi:MAG: hypothetical protein R3E18_13800 [Sphingomonadaceae bacterium]